jgi:predicted dehydrogenase
MVFTAIPASKAQANEKVKLAVAGLTHTHVHWIFESEKRSDAFEIVAIMEPNQDLAQRYAKQHGFSMDIVYPTHKELLANSQPDGVTAFGTIFEHLEVTEIYAPLGIHIMVEKPLAVSMEHAHKMKALAEAHGIHLLTNYETTWYPTNHKAKELLDSGVVGEVRKVVVHDGHKGPSKLGINSEFLDWLLDPVENGGGAVTDFGCYGANLMTWLMHGERPNSVTALLQQFQPENNPKVDDEATILLAYDHAQAVIQASWNWPIGRKDMQIYGLTGVIYQDNRNDLRVRQAVGYDGFTEESYKLDAREAPLHDPFDYFAAVIRGELEVEPNSLSSLENNMIVMEILDAAIRSANTGQRIEMK